MFVTNTSAHTMRSFLLLLEFFDQQGHLLTMPVLNSRSASLRNPLPRAWLDAYAQQERGEIGGHEDGRLFFDGPLMTLHCPTRAVVTYAHLMFEGGEQFSSAVSELVLDPLIVHAPLNEPGEFPALVLGVLQPVAPPVVRIVFSSDPQEIFVRLPRDAMRAAEVAPDDSTTKHSVAFAIFPTRVIGSSMAVAKLKSLLHQNRTVERLEVRRVIGYNPDQPDQMEIRPTTASSGLTSLELRKQQRLILPRCETASPRGNLLSVRGSPPPLHISG